MPFAIVEATKTTWMRTGAVTAIGAKYLARPDSRVIAHIGARGTARYNLLMLSHLFPIEEIRVISKRAESRDRLVKDLQEEHRLPARGANSYEEAVKDADIVVDSTRLETSEVLIHRDWLKPGVLLVPYGWVMSIDPQIPFVVDKLVVDDWKQCCEGGQLYPLISSGQLTERHLYGEIGEIVACRETGERNPGRTDSFLAPWLCHKRYHDWFSLLSKGQGNGTGATPRDIRQRRMKYQECGGVRPFFVEVPKAWKGRHEKKIKEFARKNGVDIVGIASVTRFEGAPRAFHPKDILPEAQSVRKEGKLENGLITIKRKDGE